MDRPVTPEPTTPTNQMAFVLIQSKSPEQKVPSNTPQKSERLFRANPVPSIGADGQEEEITYLSSSDENDSESESTSEMDESTDSEYFADDSDSDTSDIDFSSNPTTPTNTAGYDIDTIFASISPGTRASNHELAALIAAREQDRAYLTDLERRLAERASNQQN